MFVSLTCCEVENDDNRMQPVETSANVCLLELDSEYKAVCLSSPPLCLQFWGSDAPKRPGETADGRGKVSSASGLVQEV